MGIFRHLCADRGSVREMRTGPRLFGLSLGAHRAQLNPPIASIRERQTVDDDICHSAPDCRKAQKRDAGMLPTVLRYNSPRARIHVYTCANASESPDLFWADGERIEFSGSTCGAAALFSGAELVRRR